MLRTQGQHHIDKWNLHAIFVVYEFQTEGFLYVLSKGELQVMSHFSW